MQRSESTDGIPLDALMEELRASNTAAILELSTETADPVHRRTSLYALMVDRRREGEGCLRRIAQREEVAFYPTADVCGALLHPHVDLPIEPGCFDQHSGVRRVEEGGHRQPSSVAAERRRLEDCLTQLPGFSSATCLVSDPAWKEAEQFVGGYAVTAVPAASSSSPRCDLP